MSSFFTYHFQLMIEEKFLSFCQEHSISSCSVLVAVSGGSDSVTLAYLFNKFSYKLSLKNLAFAHVNYCLRGEESEKDAEFVHKLAEFFKCAIFYKKIDRNSIPEAGIESWARDERYSFFNSIKLLHGFDWVATGHTADDQVETLIFRLMRGSGLRGLRSILPVLSQGIIRPQIQITKSEIQSWLISGGYSWVEDCSNENQEFSRNWIRHSIVSQISQKEPLAIERIASSVHRLQDGYVYIDKCIQNWIKRYCFHNDHTIFIVKKPDSDVDLFITKESFSFLLKEHGIRCDEVHVDTCMQALRRKSGKFLLSGNWEICPSLDRLTFLCTSCRSSFPRHNVEVLPIPGQTVFNEYKFSLELIESTIDDLEFDKSNWVIYLDKTKVKGALFCGITQKGDVLQPLGSSKNVLLSSYLKKRGLNAFERESIVVVKNEANTIVWVPGIIIDDRFKILKCGELKRDILKCICSKIG